MKNNYSYIQNHDCEYFPCHACADPSSFNCLFCYCPLYPLGRNCGGNFTYTETGRKDCSGCLVPHRPEGYDYIVSRYEEIAALEKKT